MKYASLCILSYQRPKFLAQGIESLLRNAEYPLELIVHDDGSTDTELRDYLHRLADSGMVSLIMMNPPGHNEGQGIALNRMFHAARGDYIFKLDQDLLYSPGWLRRAVEILDSDYEYHEKADRFGEPYVQPKIGLLGLLHYWYEPVKSDQCKIADHISNGVPWQEHTIILGSAFALTRESWEHFGPFEERSEAFAEDNAKQVQITEADGWCCALPMEDLVENIGMGVGPSTVVVARDTVAEIHDGPRVFTMEAQT